MKRRNNFVLGGSYFFALIACYYRLRPFGGSNLVAVRWTKRKFKVVVDVLDFQVFNHTLPLLSGRSVEARLLKLLLPEGGIFIDIGANYGVYSLLAANLGAGKVIAFEPQPKLVEALNQSIQINGMEQVSVQCCALGAVKGECNFYLPSHSSGTGSLFKSHVEQSGGVRATIAVEVKVLDELFREWPLETVDVIKIDVEGAEFQVLSGSRATLLRQAPFVWFELNPKALGASESGKDGLFALFKSCGYTSFFNAAKVVHGELEPLGQVSRLTNVLAVPTTRMSFLRDALARIDQEPARSR